MKTTWMALLLVLWLLLYWLGCIPMADSIEYLGTISLFVGIIGLFEKIWPEVVI